MLGKKLEKGAECEELRTSGWTIAPLTLEGIRYATFDARMSFEIAARSKVLVPMLDWLVVSLGSLLLVSCQDGCRVVARPLTITSLAVWRVLACLHDL